MNKEQTITLTMQGFWRGIFKILPLSLFFIPFGLGYGLAAIEKGLSATETILISTIVFSGATQFATLDLWQESSMISIMIIAFTVSMRFILFSATIAPWVNQVSISKRLLGHLTFNDASFADCYENYKNGKEKDIGVLFGASFIIWFTWVIGTVIGVVLGGQITNFAAFGLHALMPCYFTAILLSCWDRGRVQIIKLVPYIAAALITIFTKDILPEGWNIISAALSAGILAGLLHGH